MVYVMSFSNTHCVFDLLLPPWGWPQIAIIIVAFIQHLTAGQGTVLRNLLIFTKRLMLLISLLSHFTDTEPEALRGHAKFTKSVETGLELRQSGCCGDPREENWKKP